MATIRRVVFLCLIPLHVCTIRISVAHLSHAVASVHVDPCKVFQKIQLVLEADWHDLSCCCKDFRVIWHPQMVYPSTMILCLGM